MIRARLDDHRRLRPSRSGRLGAYVRPPRRQGGFTIVELLIAMVLTTILVAIAFQIGVIVVSGYRQHREAVAVQRAARGSLDLISEMVRNGAAGVPTGNVKDAAGCTNFTGLSVVNSTSAPDELYVIGAAGQAVTSTRAYFDQSMTTLTVVDASNIADNDLVILTDFAKGHVVRVNGTPVDNGDGTWTITLDSISCAMTFHYERGALVLRAKVARFYVADVDGVPTMMEDDDSDGPDEAEPLAEGVEDFQVAVGVDSNSDGTVTEGASTADEWFYNVSGDADPPSIITKPWTALRMTVIARTEREDTGEQWSTRPGAEDHLGATAADGYRRREASTTVVIRNLNNAP